MDYTFCIKDGFRRLGAARIVFPFMTKSFVEFQFTHDIVEFITLFESRNTFSATSANICMSKWKQSIDVAFINHHSLCIWIIRKNDLRFLCKWYCVIVFRYRCKESLMRFATGNHENMLDRKSGRTSSKMIPHTDRRSPFRSKGVPDSLELRQQKYHR